MRSKVERHSAEAEKAVRDIRRATRRQYSAEEKVRIVIAGLRGEDSIAELCRKEGINQNLYYRWSKDFLEAGKKRLAGDTAREATSDEVKGLRAETHQLKELLAELMVENRLLKKSVLGDGESDTNGIVERFHKTVLNEFYRVAFRRKIYSGIEQLQADLDAWLREYNELRPHQGRWCYGKTPMQTFRDSVQLAKEKMLGSTTASAAAESLGL